MIALSTPTYDPNGYLLLERVRPTNAYQAARRGSVTATLDGESSVYDTGYSTSDQTITASWNHPTREQLIQIRYLVAYYAELILSTESGCYVARVSFALNKGTATLSMRLLRRLDT